MYRLIIKKLFVIIMYFIKLHIGKQGYEDNAILI